MKRISVVLALLGAGAMLASCSGRQRESSQGEVRVPTEVERNGQVGLQDRKVEVPKGADAVKTALETLFKYANGRSNSIPAGTRLLDLKVENGTAHLDLSKEFNKLEGAGNEGESMAQKALKRTLAQFKDIETMVVRVEGKPFESEHTDWTQPIPVRDKEDVARDERHAPIGLPRGGGE